MIDLHCHLIFDTDDGAKTIEDSIEMLKEAYQAGFTEICCTPHYLEPEYIKTKKENKRKLNQIQKRLDEENIDIKLYLGNEVYITGNIKELFDLKNITTIADSSYILIELPLSFKMDFAEEITQQLIFNGFNVILAHPERYLYVQKDIKYLDDFLEQGVYLQCNYESLIGKYGIKAQKVVKKLLKQQKVDLFSTDTHRANSTYTRMDKILKVLKKYTKEEYYEKVTITNPQKILENKKL